MITEASFSAKTVVALAAKDRGIESHRVTWGQSDHSAADTCHLPCGFVSHDNRRYAATGRSVISVDVTAANATGRDLDEDLIGGRFWNREIHNLEMAIL